MLNLYNTLLLPVRPLVGGWAAWDEKRHPDRRVEWAERLGRRLPAGATGGLWLHGASVGEARLVTRLAAAVRRRRPDLPVVASAVTRTGRSQLPATPEVDAAFFAPLDFRGPTSRVAEAVSPAVLGSVETELWPNLIHRTADRGARVIVVNGRLAPERMRHYRRWSSLYRPLVARIARVAAQSPADAERFAEIGVADSRIAITGNLKYDLEPPAVDADEIRRSIGCPADRPIWVAGSTAEGEDAVVLEAFAALRRRHPDLLLILAPRHPERAESVAGLARDAGWNVAAWSRLGDRRDGPPLPDLLLVDSVGQLSGLYAAAQVAFVGGSLVPRGGHNLLEPAGYGVPVLFGPHTHHVAEPAEALLAAGGAVRVTDAATLVAAIDGWLTERGAGRRAGERARGVLEASRGALDRTLELLLDEAHTGAGS